MGQKAKNAGKKQSKTCNKPVSPYWKVHKAKNASIKKYTSLNHYSDIDLYTDENSSQTVFLDLITNKGKNIAGKAGQKKLLSNKAGGWGGGGIV